MGKRASEGKGRKEMEANKRGHAADGLRKKKGNADFGPLTPNRLFD